MADEIFGDRLKRHRTALGLSIVALAKRAGCDKSYISYLESGRRGAPTREMTEALADALELPEGSADRDRLYLLAGLVPPGLQTARLLLTCQMARRAARGGA